MVKNAVDKVLKNMRADDSYQTIYKKCLNFPAEGALKPQI